MGMYMYKMQTLLQISQFYYVQFPVMLIMLFHIPGSPLFSCMLKILGSLGSGDLSWRVLWVL